MHKLFLSLHGLFDIKQLHFNKAADTEQSKRQVDKSVLLIVAVVFEVFIRH